MSLQLLCPLDVAGVDILAKVDGLPELEELIVQVGVELFFDQPLGLQVLIVPANVC